MNKLKLAMFRELEAERDKARTWAAGWKRAAKGWKENAYLSEDRVEVWRQKADARRLALADVEAECDSLEVGFQELAHRWDGLAGYNPLMTPADNWNQLRAKMDQLQEERDILIDANNFLKEQAGEWRDQLRASTELLQLREEQLAEELKRRAELEQELKLNASMLARQCDLAREAETERDELKQKLEVCQAEMASLREALTRCRQFAHDWLHSYADTDYALKVIAQADKVLSTTAGTDFLDRMRKLEACQAEEASWKVKYQTLVARLTE